MTGKAPTAEELAEALRLAIKAADRDNTKTHESHSAGKVLARWDKANPRWTKERAEQAIAWAVREGIGSLVLDLLSSPSGKPAEAWVTREACAFLDRQKDHQPEPDRPDFGVAGFEWGAGLSEWGYEDEAGDTGRVYLRQGGTIGIGESWNNKE